MKIVDLSRRKFLRGAGGFSLALPFLESLAPRAALGDTVYRTPRRLFTFQTDHGAVRPEYLFPDPATITERKEIYTGHVVGRGKLVRTVDGTFASASRWIRASSSALTDRLLGKLNVIQGLDTPWYCGHNTGALLGNVHASNTDNKIPPTATVDQVLGWSNKFYTDVSTVKQRVAIFGSPFSGSFNWAQPAQRAGDVVAQAPTAYSARDLFHRLFDGAVAPMPGAPPRKPVVDRVLADFKRLRNGTTRLSTKDKAKLDEHIDGLAELDRKLNARVTAPSCTNQPVPADVDLRDRAGLLAVSDVIKLAFMCGTSHIVVGHAYNTPPFDDYPDWHGVAHKSWVDKDSEEKMLEHHRWVFENLFLAVASKLDAVEETSGTTYLDNSLLFFGMECGPHTHEDCSIPIVTAGAAGGTITTGQFLDYRNQTPSSLRKFGGDEGYPQIYAGLTMNQWLATVAQALGLDRADFELGGKPGFGVLNVDDGYKGRYVPGVVENASDWLPFLKA